MLVQELDDTHGIALPDDEAAKITTVGEAAGRLAWADAYAALCVQDAASADVLARAQHAVGLLPRST